MLLGKLLKANLRFLLLHHLINTFVLPVIYSFLSRSLMTPRNFLVTQIAFMALQVTLFYDV
jgi:hypothetical protein